jgi:hypothetical protein
MFSVTVQKLFLTCVEYLSLVGNKYLQYYHHAIEELE